MIVGHVFGSAYNIICGGGQVERGVYLPRGSWVRTSDGKRYAGEQYVTVHAELEDFIAFVPENSAVLPVFDLLI